MLTVIDSGRGIVAELLPHVFDRFRQGESGTTRSHGGLGLGLSIARQLVELHGGTIEAASPGEGGGATFTVRLPAVDAVAAPGPPATPAEARPPRPLERVHVLVVDDDAETREVMAVALGLQGALVTTAPSVAEAIAAVERDWPDVLLSDIGMPGEDGYDLIRQVRGLEAVRGRHIAAIALTAYAAADDRRRALEAGYEAHLAKPVPAATVAPLIAGLLGSDTRLRARDPAAARDAGQRRVTARMLRPALPGKPYRPPGRGSAGRAPVRDVAARDAGHRSCSLAPGGRRTWTWRADA